MPSDGLVDLNEIREGMTCMPHSGSTEEHEIIYICSVSVFGGHVSTSLFMK